MKQVAKRTAKRKAAPKKAAKRGVAKKRAAKAASARRSAAKRAPAKGKAAPGPSRTARATPGQATRKRAAAKRAKRATTGRATTAVAPWRSAKTRAAVRAPLSFPQRAGASVKLAVLFELARARTALLAAIQGMVAGSAERPHGEGKWNTRQHVLHLAFCDEIYVEDTEMVLAGVTPPRTHQTKEGDDRENAEALARMAHLSWDEALRRLHAARLRLLETVEGIDEAEPVWGEGHLFRRMMRSVALHDRHHADAIKRWRTASND